MFMTVNIIEDACSDYRLTCSLLGFVHDEKFINEIWTISLVRDGDLTRFNSCSYIHLCDKSFPFSPVQHVSYYSSCTIINSSINLIFRSYIYDVVAVVVHGFYRIFGWHIYRFVDIIDNESWLPWTGTKYFLFCCTSQIASVQWSLLANNGIHKENISKQRRAKKLLCGFSHLPLRIILNRKPHSLFIYFAAFFLIGIFKSYTIYARTLQHALVNFLKWLEYFLKLNFTGINRTACFTFSLFVFLNINTESFFSIS